VKIAYPPGATPLDPNEAAGLIPNIALQSELNAREEANILKARQWALSPRNRKLKSGILSSESLCLLHQKMFDDVWTWSGQFRQSEKNLGVSWFQIPIALHELCEDVKAQISHRSYYIDECAVRFHHRLVKIHAFPNGNGRHARLAADILLLSNGGKEFSWGQGLLEIPSGTRSRYIQALRVADEGDIMPLLAFARSSSSDN
jgi:Fic-DOC domain mobile mystery protein B